MVTQNLVVKGKENARPVRQTPDLRPLFKPQVRHQDWPTHYTAPIVNTQPGAPPMEAVVPCLCTALVPLAGSRVG